MDAFTGAIIPWPLDWAPDSWAICDGSLLNLNHYQALFSLLGTTFGGDGKTTFGLPDLRGRTILGFGTGPGLTKRDFAQKDGKESVQLTVQMLAPHAHTATFTPAPGGSASGSLKASSATGTTSDPTNNYIANGGLSSGPPGTPTTKVPGFIPPANAGALADVAGLTVTGTGGGGGKVVVDSTGGTQAVPTVPPFVALNYIICLNGIYPMRPS